MLLLFIYFRTVSAYHPHTSTIHTDIHTCIHAHTPDPVDILAGGFETPRCFGPGHASALLSHRLDSVQLPCDVVIRYIASIGNSTNFDPPVPNLVFNLAPEDLYGIDASIVQLRMCYLAYLAVGMLRVSECHSNNLFHSTGLKLSCQQLEGDKSPSLVNFTGYVPIGANASVQCDKNKRFPMLSDGPCHICPGYWHACL